MKLSLALIMAAGLAVSASSFAAADTTVTTATCKDGTSYTGVHKGACSGHKGVQTWGAAPAAPAAPAAAAPAAAAAAPAAMAKPAAASSAKAAKTVAPGGGAGLVWENTSSKVYHCQGDKDYGTTKAGKYVSEAAAKADGAHASHGKACS
ncbi:DUF3761 domain-containing protein [Glaciimonas soli]|uniref:DUF3761 domain-containing protein n=1 Tax=Glaciimonas soli TaxID=2590999 RepID=A0A843YRD5_9BURK|nr:DUF3761 domain-containing protein [Glaciimonas soli]MQR01680.1 DUF3761 domain-containing protein [Glaciimonas soli]